MHAMPPERNRASEQVEKGHIGFWFAAVCLLANQVVVLIKNPTFL